MLYSDFARNKWSSCKQVRLYLSKPDLDLVTILSSRCSNTLGHKLFKFHSVSSAWRPAVKSLPLHQSRDSTDVPLHPGIIWKKKKTFLSFMYIPINLNHNYTVTLHRTTIIQNKNALTLLLISFITFITCNTLRIVFWLAIKSSSWIFQGGYRWF